MVVQGHENEAERLAEIRRHTRVLTSGVFGMQGDAELSQIVASVATSTDFPFAAVSIVDRSRLWLTVAYGFDPREFARPHSFCDAAIKVPGFKPLCVPDAWREDRFMLAPAVIELNIRAYYAAPLVTADGLALGTLCLLDQRPRHVGQAELDVLTALASEAAAIIDRQSNAQMYAQSAVVELTRRIRSAVAKKDDAQVALLDLELRRIERTLEPHWH